MITNGPPAVNSSAIFLVLPPPREHDLLARHHRSYRGGLEEAQSQPTGRRAQGGRDAGEVELEPGRPEKQSHRATDSGYGIANSRLSRWKTAAAQPTTATGAWTLFVLAS
jgi:hypothetical protein